MDKTNPDQKSKALLDEISSGAPQGSKIVKLIEEGADLNYQSSKNGYTPLMYALKSENTPIIDYLLKAGANPLIKNHQQLIASDLIPKQKPTYKQLKNYELLFATSANDVAAVTKLLSQEVDVNFQGPGKYSALLIAVEQSNLELVELLLANGADLSTARTDGQGVFELVTDSLIFITLQKGKPLNEEKKKKFINRNGISNEELYEQARLKTLAERQNQPFDVSQLQIDAIALPASEAQINELEQQFGHPIPANLKEIFRHYNGGRPKLNNFGDYDAHDSIRYFYTLNDDTEHVNCIWNIIKIFNEILGPNTLPFAEHSYSSVYFLKWEENQAKVYLLMYGDLAYEHLEEDELNEFDDHTPPHIIEKTCDSFDEFLESLYEVN